MPFIANTPESFISGPDSKIPNTTCRGIATNGRPCRRPLTGSASSPTPTQSTFNKTTSKKNFPTSPPTSPTSNTSSKRQSLHHQHHQHYNQYQQQHQAQASIDIHDDPSNPNAYCLSHKDQALASARSSPGPVRTGSRFDSIGGRVVSDQRASLDALVDRLGITDPEHNIPDKMQRRQSRPASTRTGGAKRPGSSRTYNGKPPTQFPNYGTSAMPSGRSSRRTSRGEDMYPMADAYPQYQYPEYPQSPKKSGPVVVPGPKKPAAKPRQSSGCLCFGSSSSPATKDDDDVAPRPVRPKPRPVQSAPPSMHHGRGGGIPSRRPTINASTPSVRRPTANYYPSAPTVARPSTAMSDSSASSQTSEYLNLIPINASPQTASLLLAELAKPFSMADEAGYICVFWLKPQNARMPSMPSPTQTTSKSSKGGKARRESDALAKFAAAAAGSLENSKGGSSSKHKANSSKKASSRKPKKPTMLLRIGRATNVERRLNEWGRQCGYDPSLVRYYPYVPSSASGNNYPGQQEFHYGGGSTQHTAAHRRTVSDSFMPVPRKVPHSQRVERLVHIELAGLGLKAKAAGQQGCNSCGRVHKEWFEVESSRKGIVAIDDVIRRWCEWDERNGDGNMMSGW